MQEISVELITLGIRVKLLKTKPLAGKTYTYTLAHGGIVVSVVLWLAVSRLNSISVFSWHGLGTHLCTGILA